MNPLLPANYLDMLEDAYPEGEAEDAEEYISKLYFVGITERSEPRRNFRC